MRLFEQKIKEIQYKQSAVIIAKYLFLAVSILCLIFNIFFAVFFLDDGHLGEKFLFAISLKISLAFIMVYFSLKLNRELLSKKQAAKLLDSNNNDKNDTYQNAWDLLTEQGEVDSIILQQIYENADEMAKQQNIKIDFSIAKTITIIMSVLLISNGIIWLIVPQKFMEVSEFFALRSLPEVSHKTFIEVSPGNKELLRGSDVTISVLNPEAETEHILFYKQHQVWREQKILDNEYEFKNIEYSTDYFIKNQYATSDTFYLKVYELPALKEISAKVSFPKYTKLQEQINNTGNFQIPEGSEIALSIIANNPIETAKIIINREVTEMKRLGKSSFSHKFTPAQSGSYYFALTDILGNSSQKINRNITLRNDETPNIEIVHPAIDTILSQNMLLPLIFSASDDFGIDDIELHYYLNSEKQQQQNIYSNLGKTLLKADYVFDVRNLGLFPGDKITYWLEITDNKPTPQRNKSAYHTARFPSIEEIYNEIAEEEKIRKDLLDETLKKSTALNEEFEEKRRELMKKEDIEWEDKKELEKFLQNQESLNKDVEKIASDYQKMMQKFEDNQALSAETLEKMEKIRELMEEITNDELLEAMKKMQNSLENMDAGDINKALEQMKFSLEDFSEKLEQTLQLLENIKKEQALQKACEIADEMEKMQADLHEKTEQSKENGDDLAKRQADIARKLESLEEQISEASKLFDEKKDAALKQMMEQLQKEMSENELSQDLQQAIGNLQEKKMQQAMENQQSAMQKMQNLNQKLSEMSTFMSSMNMSANMESLNIAIKRLLIFSEDHEELSKRYNYDPYLIIADLIANYEGINKTVQELYSTPMILLILGPKFIYDTNGASRSFQELFSHINNAQNTKVEEFLHDIQKGLNLMIYDLILAKDNMQNSGGGGGGMESLMQSLQQMGQQQQMMNMLSLEMMQQMGQNGRISQEMYQQLGKMAADEQRLADNLKRAIQNNPDAQKQVSSLNKMIEDLENISRNLKRGRITQDIIDTQERILSRLLDAQKSIHKREFSKKRKAESSEVDDWDTPEEIKMKFEKMRRKALLEEDYQQYSKEHQALIKEYLKKLNED